MSHTRKPLIGKNICVGEMDCVTCHIGLSCYITTINNYYCAKMF